MLAGMLSLRNARFRSSILAAVGGVGGSVFGFSRERGRWGMMVVYLSYYSFGTQILGC